MMIVVTVTKCLYSNVLLKLRELECGQRLRGYMLQSSTSGVLDCHQ